MASSTRPKSKSKNQAPAPATLTRLPSAIRVSLILRSLDSKSRGRYARVCTVFREDLRKFNETANAAMGQRSSLEQQLKRESKEAVQRKNDTIREAEANRNQILAQLEANRLAERRSLEEQLGDIDARYAVSRSEQQRELDAQINTVTVSAEEECKRSLAQLEERRLEQEANLMTLLNQEIIFLTSKLDRLNAFERKIKNNKKFYRERVIGNCDPGATSVQVALIGLIVLCIYGFIYCVRSEINEEYRWDRDKWTAPEAFCLVLPCAFSCCLICPCKAWIERAENQVIRRDHAVTGHYIDWRGAERRFKNLEIYDGLYDSFYELNGQFEFLGDRSPFKDITDDTIITFSNLEEMVKKTRTILNSQIRERKSKLPKTSSATVKSVQPSSKNTGAASTTASSSCSYGSLSSVSMSSSTSSADSSASCSSSSSATSGFLSSLSTTLISMVSSSSSSQVASLDDDAAPSERRPLLSEREEQVMRLV